MRPDRILDRQVSRFPVVTNTGIQTPTELKAILDGIKGQLYKTRIINLRELKQTDVKEYAAKKKLLPAFTMSALCKHRKAGVDDKEKLIYHTGIIQVDIDSIDPDKLSEYKAIVNKDRHTVFSFLSPSGLGIKGGVRTETSSSDDHKAAFLSVQNYYRQTYNIEIDPAVKDLFRLCYVSYDPDLFINDDPDILDVERYSPPPPERQPVTQSFTPITTGIKDKQIEQGIKTAVKILDSSSDGNRHESRIKAGRLIGGYIGGGLLTENEALNRLYPAIMRNTTGTEKQAIKDVSDGIKHGKAEPITPAQLQAEYESYKQQNGGSKVTYYNGRSRTATQSVTTEQTKRQPPIEALRTKHKEKVYHQTEVGNSLRFSDYYRGRLLHNYTDKDWYIWTGKIWRPDTKGKVNDRAKNLIKKMRTEAYGITDETEQKNLINWVKQSEKQRSISAMLELAKSDLPVETTDFDSDPYKITCKNVTIDLKTLETYKPDRDDLITKQIKATYDPAAKCPEWDRFLTTIFLNDRDLIRYIQKLIGYCLTGNTDDQAFYILYGTGSNGKSTFIQVIKQLLGSYFHTAPDHSFLISPGKAEDSPDVVKWQGKRIVTAEETEDNRRLNLSLIKRVSGSDEISARQLFCEPIQFIPECKLFLITNHKPSIKSQIYAVWRRVRLIPFLYAIPETEQIEPAELQQRFNSELSGIFNWALNGLELYYEQGLKLPDSVKAATEDYKGAEDTLKDFLEDETEIDPSSSAPTKSLYQSYINHTRENDPERRPVGSKTFTQLLAEKGFEKGHNTAKTKRVFFGLKLKIDPTQTY